MAAEESGTGTARRAGFLSPLKKLTETLVSFLKTRLELLATEIEEERERLKEIILLALIALFCACFGLILLTFLIVVAFWETYRLYVLGGFVILYFGLGLVAALVMRRKVVTRPKFLAATLSVLAKDRESLKP